MAVLIVFLRASPGNRGGVVHVFCRPDTGNKKADLRRLFVEGYVVNLSRR